MAKRLAAEKPYTPLDDSLLKFVLQPHPAEVPPQEPPAEVRAAPEKVTRRRLGKHDEAPVDPALAVLPAPRHMDAGRRENDQPAPRPALERMNSVLRLKVSVREKREFEAFVARLAGVLDTTLKPSNLLRGLLTVVQHSEAAVSDIASRHGPFRRPPNDDAVAYAEFEQHLVRLLDSAIRNSTPLK